MKKVSLAILILVILGLFALADYYANLPGGIPRPLFNLSSRQADESTMPEAVELPNITKQILDQGGLTANYKIEKRTRSTELFESFDMSELANIVIYRNILISADAVGQLPIQVYEIHGPKGQGSLTYLNIKLAMIEKLDSEAGLNETGDIGYNSLFYNDDKNPSTGFLLSQVEDIVFGFKYDKKSRPAFDFIKSLVNNYMQSFS
ncbi:hypothetical protein JXD20_04005 [Candidatus Peregrinibacteria bacterium]|nr:hypothetical protein [Candidatus Peregrinibacteria bacterium]